MEAFVLSGDKCAGLTNLVDVGQEHASSIEDAPDNAEAHAHGVGFSSRRAGHYFSPRYRSLQYLKRSESATKSC